MGPELILIAGVLVDVWRYEDREPLFLGRQRYRPPDLSPGPLGRFNDFPRRNVDQPVVESLEPDPDVLVVCHISLSGLDPINPLISPAAVACHRVTVVCKFRLVVRGTQTADD